MADDLHQKLLARLDVIDDAASLYYALRAVVALHEPVEDRIGDRLVRLECHGCDEGGGYDWDWPDSPCSTIQAITRELGVDGG